MPHLIHIGNSLGVRIPKALISQVGFEEDIELQFKVTGNGLLISPVSKARKDWSKAFKGKKEPLHMEENIVNQFDEDEWEW